MATSPPADRRSVAADRSTTGRPAPTAAERVSKSDPVGSRAGTVEVAPAVKSTDTGIKFFDLVGQQLPLFPERSGKRLILRAERVECPIQVFQLGIKFVTRLTERGSVHPIVGRERRAFGTDHLGPAECP